MFYDGYHFIGMHLIWWIFWIFFIFILFGWFDTVPKKHMSKASPHDLLLKRFASGQITKEEYLDHKAMIEKHQQSKD